MNKLKILSQIYKALHIITKTLLKKEQKLRDLKILNLVSLKVIIKSSKFRKAQIFNKNKNKKMNFNHHFFMKDGQDKIQITKVTIKLKYIYKIKKNNVKIH